MKQAEKKWRDPDFGPLSDKQGGAFSIYYDGQDQDHLPSKLEDIQWLRPEQYLADVEDATEPVFIKAGSSSNEVKQGNIGNCWFISALSILATHDELIVGSTGIVDKDSLEMLDSTSVAECSKGLLPAIFHRFTKIGVYCFRFFKNYSWRYVIIDTELPYDKNFQTLVFAKCLDPSELWVPLIEKAYAKLAGCYQALTSGNIDDGLVDMTGYACEKLKYSEDDYYKNKEAIWEQLMDAVANNSLMGCSRSPDGAGVETDLEIESIGPTGLVCGHAYSIMSLFELHDSKMQNPRKTHRLFHIRNPWGEKEWIGPWSGGESDDKEKLETHR